MNRTTEANEANEADVRNGKPLGKERATREKGEERATREKGDEKEHEIFYIKRRGIKRNQIDYSSDESVDNDNQVANDIEYVSDVENMQLNRDEDAYNSEDNGGSYIQEESNASDVFKIRVGDCKTFKKKMAARTKDDIGIIDDDNSSCGRMIKKPATGDVGELDVVAGKPKGKKSSTWEKDDIDNSGYDGGDFSMFSSFNEETHVGELDAVAGKPNGKKRATWDTREKDGIDNSGDDEGDCGSFDEETHVGEFDAVAGKPNRKKRATWEKDGIDNSGDDQDKDLSTDEESKTHSKQQKYRNPKLPRSFCIYLTREEWLSIAPSKSKPSKLRRGWTNIIYDKFHQKNSACVLNIKHHHVRKPLSRKRNSPYFVAQGTCSHENCAKYILTIKDIPTRGNITILVDRIGSVKHTAGVFKKRKCAGDKRVEAKREVKATAPSELYMARLADMSDTEIQAGNLTACQSRDVLKTISSEGNKTDRLHDDVFMELVTAHYLYRDTGLNSKIPGYIQNLSYEPFYVICFLEEQIHILRNACKDRNSVLCFDATGTGIVRPTESKKKIFYFSMVLKNEKGQPPLSVADMLSNSQSMPTITLFLMTVRRALSTIMGGRIPKLPHIETDWSWAMLQSSCLAANNMNISEYLRRVFAGNTDDLTPIHICSAHVIHRIAWKCAQNTKNKELKEYLVRFFCTLLVQTSLKGITSYLASICRVLLSEKETPEVNKHLKRLTAVDIDAEHDLGEHEVTEEYGIRKFKTMRQNSPYFAYFKDVLVKERKKVPKTTHGEDNPLFCSWFIDVLLKEYLPFVPLWTSMMLRVKEPEGEPRMTNNDIEQWMGQVKNRIWEKRSRIRPLWAIRKLHTSIKGRIRHKRITTNKDEMKSNKKRKLPLPKIHQKSQPKYFKKSKKQLPVKKIKPSTPEQDVTLLEETWERKTPRKKKPKYFKQAPAASKHEIESLPWSGFYKGVNVTNTCPLDNFLMAFHLILTRRKDIRDQIEQLDDSIGDGANACKNLLKVHKLFVKGAFQHGRYLWLTDVCGMAPENNTIDAWGTQSAIFTNYVVPIQEMNAESSCSNVDCTKQKRKMRYTDIILK